MHVCSLCTLRTRISHDQYASYDALYRFFHSDYDWQDLFIDSLWLVDIVVSIVSGFVAANGVVELRWKKSLKHYFRGWFLIDVLATFPFYLVASDGNGVSTLFRLPRIFKLLRFFRLMKVCS
jgi:hypothetical protein